MAVLLIVCLIFIVAVLKRINIFSAFGEGVKEGCITVYNILPALVLIMTAISVFRASGLLDIIIYIIKPFTELIGIPEQAVPLAVMRPFSGSGSLAILEDIIRCNGVESRAATVGAILCASTETTFYTLSVYLSSFTGKCWKLLLCSIIADFSVVVTVGLIV